MSDPALHTLTDLADALSAGALDAGALAERLGGGTSDLAGNLVVDGPTVEGVSRAVVVREVHGARLSHLSLQLATPLAEADLEAALGAPKRVTPDHDEEPDQLLYRLHVAGDAADVTLIAASVDGVVHEVALRPDSRAS